MRITLMASMGKGQDKLVAVDNVIIKMSSNKSRNGTFTSEPERDIKFKVFEHNFLKDTNNTNLDSN